MISHRAAEQGLAVLRVDDQAVEPIHPLRGQAACHSNFVICGGCFCWFHERKYTDRAVLSGSDLSIELGYCFGKLEQTQLAGADDGFGAVLNLEFIENPLVVPLDRAERQIQPLADFGVGKSLCDET